MLGNSLFLIALEHWSYFLQLRKKQKKTFSNINMRVCCVLKFNSGSVEDIATKLIVRYNLQLDVSHYHHYSHHLFPSGNRESKI